MRYLFSFIFYLFLFNLNGQAIKSDLDNIITNCVGYTNIIRKDVPYKAKEWWDKSDYYYWSEIDYFYESNFYYYKFEQNLYIDLYMNRSKWVPYFKTKLRNNESLDHIFIYDFMFFLQDIKKDDYLDLVNLLLVKVENLELPQEIFMASIEHNFFNNYYSSFILKNAHKEKVRSILLKAIRSSKISRPNKEILANYFKRDWVKKQLKIRKFKKIKLNDAQLDF